MVKKLGMEQIKIIPLQNLRSPEERTLAINNLAYNEHNNAHFKCNEIYLNFVIGISFKFQSTIFNYYTPIMMKKLSGWSCLLMIKFM